MALTKRESMGLNQLPEFCPESQASLSRDIIELAKVSSTDLTINDICIWKASNIVRNLRAGVIVIDSLETNETVWR